MWALHAKYRGNEVRRADYVRRSAEALSGLEGVGVFEHLGVEDVRADIESAAATCDVVMALLAAGEWAVGIGIAGADVSDELAAKTASTKALDGRARAGTVKVHVHGAPRGDDSANNIAAVFALLGQVLTKRSIEGREATSLVRSGLNQNEAAEELGISKQAISQRLQAAGWQAEQAGWSLAVNLLEQAARQ